MNHPYTNLVFKLTALRDKWVRQDIELADARSGLEPEERVDEEAQDRRIALQREYEAKETVTIVLKGA